LSTRAGLRDDCLDAEDLDDAGLFLAAGEQRGVRGRFSIDVDV
jgi:hypothetical protein